MDQTQRRAPEPLDFIAFKIPVRMKRQLRILAQQQGSNLSALVRNQCTALLNERASQYRASSPGRVLLPWESENEAGTFSSAAVRPQPKQWSV